MATATIIRVPRSNAQQYISPEALKYHLHEELVLKNIRQIRPKANQDNSPLSPTDHPGLWSPPVLETSYRATVFVPSANREWFVRLEDLEEVPANSEIPLSNTAEAYDLKSPDRAVITF
jgi:hypothetical protein